LKIEVLIFYTLAHLTALCCSHADTQNPTVKRASIGHSPSFLLFQMLSLQGVTLGSCRTAPQIRPLPLEGMIFFQDGTQFKDTALFPEERKNTELYQMGNNAKTL
jgi:hypothetical protein